MIFKSISVIVVLLIVGQCQIPPEVFEGFQHYKTDFGKTYDTPTIEAAHLNDYYDNYKKVEAFIADNTNTYTLGLTIFSDILDVDYKDKLIKNAEPGVSGLYYVDVDNLAPSVDWRNIDPDYISGVKDQKDCSVSWAIAVVDAVEAYHSILTGEPTEKLSVQQILDCVPDQFIKYNCNGGWPFEALRWVQHHGLTTEADYKYTGVQGTCQKDTGTYFISTIRGINQDIIQLKAAASYRPVVVCFDAAELGLYTEGSVNKNCKKDKPNQCGLLVGYDEKDWFIKGSFGEQWGIQGYVTIKQGECGVENYAYGLLDDPVEDVPQTIMQGFDDYKNTFEKNYPDRESDYIHYFYYNWFNDQKINAQDPGFEVGYTYFTDMYPKIFQEQYLLPVDPETELNQSRYFLQEEQILGNIDWRIQGIVTAVQFQGTNCKSQWAISVVGALESYFRQQTSNKVELSAQQLIDCVETQMGCDGGLPLGAFDWIQTNGITSLINYPYTGITAEFCLKPKGELKPKSILKLGNTEENLKLALSKRPIVVCFDASQMLGYRSGIVTELICTPGVAPNHCGLAVGYDNQAWIVKSSFGLQWGEEGYVRIKMGNTCGILDNALYPQ